jgi:hypothetical protein
MKFLTQMHLCAQRLVAELIAIANGSQQLGSCSLTTPIADRSPFPTLWLGKRWIDVVTASYVYSQPRGHTALDKMLAAIKRNLRARDRSLLPFRAADPEAVSPVPAPALSRRSRWPDADDPPEPARFSKLVTAS